MGDASCQAADGIHLLGLSKLLFQLPALGDVLGDQLQYFFRFIGAARRRNR